MLRVRDLFLVGLLSVTVPMPVAAQSCRRLLGAFQAGLSDAEIADRSGWSVGAVAGCRRQLSRTTVVPRMGNPVGPPPHGAVGPPPSGAVGPPPSGAVGPPPAGALGR